MLFIVFSHMLYANREIILTVYLAVIKTEQTHFLTTTLHDDITHKMQLVSTIQ